MYEINENKNTAGLVKMCNLKAKIYNVVVISQKVIDEISLNLV